MGFASVNSRFVYIFASVNSDYCFYEQDLEDDDGMEDSDEDGKSADGTDDMLDGTNSDDDMELSSEMEVDCDDVAGDAEMDDEVGWWMSTPGDDESMADGHVMWEAVVEAGYYNCN